MTLRAFRSRFYPSYEQESLLRRTLGCVRHPMESSTSQGCRTLYRHGTTRTFGTFLKLKVKS
ncbi:helix-turn-helix domain-containing protein [Oxynema aestuarii]|uniref:helix-turn-helix domain-containing protein n=1 Tax=Oxynema aestuarii TaxID=2874213 RepID=UPI001FE6E87F|nr:helix-turn-helix domain-containing protein [Oxynema aestuarii]